MPNNSSNDPPPDDQRIMLHSHSAPIFSDGASPPLNYKNNVHGNSRGTFSSTSCSTASDHYPFGSDYHHTNKEDAARGPAYHYHDQRSETSIPLDDKQKQEWTEKQQLASFQSSQSLNVEVASDPPLYFSTIDKSMVYGNHTTEKNAQFDRRDRCIEKGGLEKSQTEHMNCERLESQDYTWSKIYQSSLPDVGASFRDIFNEDEERKAASDIFVQYPKRRIHKRRSMDLSTPFDRNEFDRDGSFFMHSHLRRKKLHQTNTPSPIYSDPVSMSAHDIKTFSTITTTIEENASTEKAYSAPVFSSPYNRSRSRFYDTRFLQDMAVDFQQKSDIHEKSTKEKSKSSFNPLCKPSFPLLQGTSMKKNVDTSTSYKTLPCSHDADHSTESIKSEKAYSAPIPTEFREDPSELKQKRESFYDSHFLDEIPSYEKLYTEEERHLSSDASPPEEVPQAKSVLKAMSRSKVQDDSSMLLYNIDDENATRFSYLVFSQIEVCSLTESDDKGKRSGLHEIGYKGMACKYCQGKSTYDGFKSGRGGRYFPKSMKTMADTTKTLMSIANHLKQCKNVPKRMKKEIIELEETHKEEQKSKPRGCHVKFCKQMWERLHGTSSPLKKKNRKQS